MKYLVKFFVVTFLFFVCTHVSAEQKIAYIDMKYILNNSKAGKKAQDFLQKKLKQGQKKLVETENSFKKQEADLLSNKAKLNKEEYTKKINDLRKQVMLHQSEKRALIEKITKQRDEARSTLLTKLTPILQSYMEENSISLVLDKKNVVIGNKGNDITDIIVDKLDKEISSLNLK
tara:strand:+ start:79 stop:603 length:525 start_codon:yes stop_codon:yes gene_type:complete